MTGWWWCDPCGWYLYDSSGRACPECGARRIRSSRREAEVFLAFGESRLAHETDCYCRPQYPVPSWPLRDASGRPRLGRCLPDDFAYHYDFAIGTWAKGDDSRVWMLLEIDGPEHGGAHDLRKDHNAEDWCRGCVGIYRVPNRVVDEGGAALLVERAVRHLLRRSGWGEFLAEYEAARG